MMGDDVMSHVLMVLTRCDFAMWLKTAGLLHTWNGDHRPKIFSPTIMCARNVRVPFLENGLELLRSKHTGALLVM